MKKLFLTIMTIFVVFGGMCGVNADCKGCYSSDEEKEVSAGETIILCEYVAPDTSDGIRIYYTLNRNVNNWIITYTEYDKPWEYLRWWLNSADTYSMDTYAELFQKDAHIHYGAEKQRSAVNEDNFICPPYAMLDLTRDDEVCFDNDTDCGDKFKKKQTQVLSKDADTIFNDINTYASTTVYDVGNITVEEFMANSDNLLNLVLTKTKEYVKNKYEKNGTYIIPDFIINYIDNLNNLNNGDNLINNEKYKMFQARMKSEIDKKVAASQITEEEGQKYKEQANKEVDDALNIQDTTITLPDSVDNTCEGLLGAQFSQYLHNIFTTIQYLGPVLVAALTIVDFIKTAVSGEKENMQKDFKRFSKRLVFAILLFFVPLIVNLILSITGVIAPSNCF